MKEKYYKILHKPTGLYKVEGQNATFSKIGKLWFGGRIKSHLKLFKTWNMQPMPMIESLKKLWAQEEKHVEECVVIEYKLVEVKRQPLREFIEQNDLNS